MSDFLPGLAIGWVCGLAIMFFAMHWAVHSDWQRSAVQNGAGHFEQTTGGFVWNNGKPAP